MSYWKWKKENIFDSFEKEKFLGWSNHTQTKKKKALEDTASSSGILSSVQLKQLSIFFITKQALHRSTKRAGKELTLISQGKTGALKEAITRRWSFEFEIISLHSSSGQSFDSQLRDRNSGRWSVKTGKKMKNTNEIIWNFQ